MALKTASLLTGGSIFSGNPGSGLVASKRPRGPINDDVDVRDYISMLVGGGYRGLTDDQSQMAYQRLSEIVGQKKAQDLVSHIIIQNTRPEFQKMQPAERVQRFYDTSSSVPATNEILQKMKGLSTGVIPGYQQSSLLQSQRQQGTAGESIIGKIADYTTKK